MTYVHKEPEHDFYNERAIPAFESIFEQAIKTVIARRDKNADQMNG